MTLVDRYIARTIAVPFVGSLAIAFMLLVIEELTRLLIVFSHAAAPATLLWQMLGCLVPEYLELAIPLALTLGILLAFRRMALASEFDIFCAAGLGLPRLLRTSYVYAGCCAAALLVIAGFIEPRAAYRFESLGFTLDSGAAGFALKVGEFNHLGDHLVIHIDRKGPGGSLLGIFLRSDEGGQTVAAMAESGRLIPSSPPSAFTLRLHRGRLIQSAPEFVTPRTLSFENYDLPVAVPRAVTFRARGSRPVELTLQELVHQATDGVAGTIARRPALAELNGRLAEAALVFLLPLLAVAFGIPPKGSESAIGVILVTLVIVADERINQYAVLIGSGGGVDPLLAVWLPFLALTVLTTWMFRATCGPRDQCPIAAMQRLQQAIAMCAESALHSAGKRPVKRKITAR